MKFKKKELSYYSYFKSIQRIRTDVNEICKLRLYLVEAGAERNKEDKYLKKNMKYGYNLKYNH